MASSPALLKELAKCSTQSVVDALWVMGYPQCQIEVRQFTLPVSNGEVLNSSAMTSFKLHLHGLDEIFRIF